MAMFGRLASIAVLFGLVFSAEASDSISRAPAEDRPLSPNIEAIPDFEPVALERPYRLGWQAALLAHQQRYVAQALPVTIDPTQTGAISH